MHFKEAAILWIFWTRHKLVSHEGEEALKEMAYVNLMRNDYFSGKVLPTLYQGLVSLSPNMPRLCAAQDCMNNAGTYGKVAHSFPSDPKLRKIWIRAAHPSHPSWIPAKGDYLCGDHFLDEDYERSPNVLRSLGLPIKHGRLKPGVTPSVFSRKRKAGRLSGAVEKRQRREVSC